MMMPENDPIRQFQSEMEDTIRKAERLRPILRSVQDAIQRADVKASVLVGKRNQLRPQVEVMMLCKRLEETVVLFRELAKEGLRTDKSESHKDHNLFNVIAMREYNLGPDVMVIAMLAGGNDDSEGPRCRMEQVGVKEVPVYEMKCD